MVGRVLLVVVGIFFLANGCSILTTEDCNSVDIGGSRRVISYSCHSSPDGGELSGGAAGGLGVAIGAGMLLIAAGPAIKNIGFGLSESTRNVRWINLLKSWRSANTPLGGTRAHFPSPSPLRDYTQTKTPTKTPKPIDYRAGEWGSDVCNECRMETKIKKRRCSECGHADTHNAFAPKVCRDCGFEGWKKKEEFRLQGWTTILGGDCPECGSANHFNCGLRLSGGSSIHCSKCIGPGNENWADVPYKRDSPYGWGRPDLMSDDLNDEWWRSRTCFKQSGLPPPPPRS